MKVGRRKLTTNGYRLLTILTTFLFLPLYATATTYEWTSGSYQIAEDDK